MQLDGIEDIILVNFFKRKDLSPYVNKINKFLFEDSASRVLYEIISNHVKTYNSLPTFQTIAVEINQRKLNETDLLNVAKKLQYIQITPPDQQFDWLKTQLEKWAQYRSAVLAINKAREIIHDDEKQNDSILEILTKAVSFKLDYKMGHNFWDDSGLQWDWYNNPETKCPSDIETLNKITAGGVAKKTLNIFLAGINVGKTTWLINMAVSMMMRGYNVLYVSGEMAEEAIRSRMDVKLLHKTSDDILNMPKETYVSELLKYKTEMCGHLFVKEFASRSASALDVKRVIHDYKAVYGITIDMLVIDYLGVFKSHTIPINQRHNSNIYGTAVAEEFRAVCHEFDMPGWTAAQLNREGQDTSEDLSMKHIADAIGIMATADFAIAGFQTPQMIQQKTVKCKILKNRYMSRTKIPEVLLGLDNDFQTFYDVDASKMSINVDVSVLNSLSQQSTKFGGNSDKNPNVKIPQQIRNPNDIKTTMCIQDDDIEDETLSAALASLMN